MPSVAPGASASVTLTTPATINLVCDPNEQLVVLVTRSGRQIYSEAMGGAKNIGPFVVGDVVTISSNRGTVDYTVVPCDAVSNKGIAVWSDATAIGTDAFRDGDVSVTYLPASAPNQSIILGRRTTLSYASNFNNTAGAPAQGHSVAEIAWFKQDGTGNPNLAIAHEAKFENNASATITNGKCYEGQLAANVGTITTFSANVSQIINNAGTVGAFVGFNSDFSGTNTGTVTTYYGFLMGDISSKPNVTTRFSFYNLDPGAPLVSKASIVDQSILRVAPAAAGSTTLYNSTTKGTYSRVELQHGGTIASHTFVLPTAAQMQDGFTMRITPLNSITAVTWTGGGVNTALLPTALSAGVTVRLWYSASSGFWLID